MEQTEEILLKMDKQGRVPKDDDRYRTFIGILYPDSTSYDCEEVLHNIKGWCKYYAYIKHMPETNEKKEHYHFIIYFDNPRYIDGVSKQLGLPKNYFQLPLSTRGSLRYLTHIDYDDKIQYNITDVVVSRSYLKNLRQAYDDEKLDTEILSDIYEFINNSQHDDPVMLEMELTMFVCTESYSRIFKTYYNTIIKYINTICSQS